MWYSITVLHIPPIDCRTLREQFARFCVVLYNGTIYIYPLLIAVLLGEQRYIYTVSLLKSICWHMEGKQFVCSYADGSLCTWIVRPANQASERSERKPTTVFFPHGKKNKDTGKIGMVLHEMSLNNNHLNYKQCGRARG